APRGWNALYGYYANAFAKTAGAPLLYTGHRAAKLLRKDRNSVYRWAITQNRRRGRKRARRGCVVLARRGDTDPHRAPQYGFHTRPLRPSWQYSAHGAPADSGRLPLPPPPDWAKPGRSTDADRFQRRCRPSSGAGSARRPLHAGEPRLSLAADRARQSQFRRANVEPGRLSLSRRLARPTLGARAGAAGAGTFGTCGGSCDAPPECGAHDNAPAMVAD